MTRPWRLTRRQRVEMEAALMALRQSCVCAPIRGEHILRASGLLGWEPLVRDRFPDGPHQWRIFRARVAIALRAALRADEDARCEEALARAGYGEATGSTPGDAWDTGYDDGADAAVAALREWPIESRDESRVPRALWERTR